MSAAPQGASDRDEPVDGDGAANEDEDDGEQGAERRSVDAPPSRRRFAPALLVIGLVAALVVGRNAVPTSRTVVVRLEGDRGEVRTVELSVGRLADGDDDVSSVQWRYEAGSPPPPVLRKELKLAPGQHRFRVQVGRQDGSQAETTRVVDVSDEEVTIRASSR